jgi:hypothetical protein
MTRENYVNWHMNKNRYIQRICVTDIIRHAQVLLALMPFRERA